MLCDAVGGLTRDDIEVVDGVPVLPPIPDGGDAAVLRTPAAAKQAAALAATGFVAGAATVALIVRHPPRWGARRRTRRRGVIGEIVGSHSFLVDVHVVRRS